MTVWCSPPKTSRITDWLRADSRQPMADSCGGDMNARAWFRCIDGCAGEIPLNEIVYRCPKCDALLEVAHDLEMLRARSPSAWMKLFDERYKRTTWPYGSGVWGKKEWVAPQVDDDNV